MCIIGRCNFHKAMWSINEAEKYMETLGAVVNNEHLKSFNKIFT